LKKIALTAAVSISLLLPASALAQSAPAAKPYVVVVAPGHGGDDPGAVYPPNSRQPDLEEKDLTLPIALKLRDRLQAQGVQVVMTRTSDVTTTAEQRAAIAEKAHANVFVSVHVNSYYPDPSVRGVEAQYFSDPALADDVADGLVLSLRDTQETVRTTKDREEDNILTMPGVIVESGYISNSADRQLLQSAAFQDAMAAGITRGVLKYAPQASDSKSQVDARQPAPAPAVPQPVNRQPAAVPAGRPGWIVPAGVGLLMALLTLASRNRSRQRRVRRPPAYGVVRYR
jgi:N-acetylmuramoyl-L-alanine amidase